VWAVDLRPAEVVMRQFPRRLFGVDPEEVKRFLAEAAATLERVNAEMARVILERSALQKTLKETREELEALRARLAEAEAALARYRGQEQLIAQIVVEAQQLKGDLLRESRAEAQRITAAAQAVAAETMGSSRAAAAELLRAARAQAEQAVESAERAAASRLAEIRLESERLISEARREAAAVHGEARRHVEALVERLENFLASSDEVSRGLAALAARQAESLRVVGEIQREIEAAFLPSLRAFVRSLTGAEARPPLLAEPGARPGEHSAGPGPATPAATPAGSQGADDEPGDAGEIVVSPVRSYLQASRLVAVVARLKGVKSARLRAYAKGSATIDVVTAGQTIGTMDPALRDAFRPDAVETTGRRLVLRLPNGGGPDAWGDAGDSGRPGDSGGPGDPPAR
jgi:cell division septum initiation protein DivIVA